MGEIVASWRYRQAELEALLEAHREEYVASCVEFLAATEEGARDALSDFEAEHLAEIRERTDG